MNIVLTNKANAGKQVKFHHTIVSTRGTVLIRFVRDR